MTLLIAVGIALGLWYFTAIAISVGLRHFSDATRTQEIGNPIDTWRSLRDNLHQLWRSNRDGFWDLIGALFEAVCYVAVGLGLFVVGLVILAAVLDGGQVAALVFGPAFLGAAFWVLRRWRRNWRRFALGNHRREVLLHLAGIIAFPIIGIVILAVGL